MGVRVAGLLRAQAPVPVIVLVVVLVLVSSSWWPAVGADNATADALLKFKNSLSNTASLSDWDPQAAPPCSGDSANWQGVLCSGGNVRGLQLENMGLSGVADVASLAALPYFRTVSFMNNTLIGPLPDLKRLARLRSVYLSYNHFSGQIPNDCFAGMRFLKKVLVSNNELEGRIPSSLAALPRLLVVRIDGNKFYGNIPDFGPSLKKINVSNNELDGPIPASLSHMDSSSFLGNKDLCGAPLRSCPIPTTNNVVLYTSFREKYSSILKLVIIVLIVVLIVALLVASCIVARSRRNKSLSAISRSSTTKHGAGRSNNLLTLPEPSTEGHQNPRKSGAGEQGKLTFLRDDRERFGLQELLRSSAEILGSGTFGSSYKATISCNALVVKRYKQMNSLGRDDFHDHMRRLGMLNHLNLLPLVAYYYRREEKLLVYDFVVNGSLAFHLHGNRSGERPALDWSTRVRIVKGVAKGLTYLYSALPSLVVPHGHLKSSNIVLNESMDPLMTDYGLLPAINLDHAHGLMMAYKSPEHAKLGRITKKTDVWCLGIVILELLSGKFPENYLTHRYDPASDLATWANEMVKERKTVLLFDPDMGGLALKSCRGEMLKLLKIALSCCEEDVERRLDLGQAVEKIDELGDSPGRDVVSCDWEFYSGITVEQDGHGSRAM